MHKLDQRLALSRQKHLRPELFADKDITPLNPIFRSNNFTIQIRYGIYYQRTPHFLRRGQKYIRTNFKINTLSKVSSLKSCVKDNHSVRIGKNCAIINCGYIFLFSQSTSKVIKQSEEKLQPPFYSVSYLKSMHLHREKKQIQWDYLCTQFFYKHLESLMINLLKVKLISPKRSQILHLNIYKRFDITLIIYL